MFNNVKFSVQHFSFLETWEYILKDCADFLLFIWLFCLLFWFV